MITLNWKAAGETLLKAINASKSSKVSDAVSLYFAPLRAVAALFRKPIVSTSALSPKP